MRKLNTLFALAVITFGAQVASAAVVINFTALPGPFGAPDAALTGFTAYQVDAATNDAALISAVDLSFAGQMHQRWSDTNFDGTPDPTPQGPASNGRGDSHMTPIAGALIGSAPTENNNIFPSPLADTATFDYGIGNSLTGAWGIPGPSQTANASLGYVVIPDGLAVTLTWAIATSNGTFNGSTLIPGVPEPSSLALGGLSLIGLAFRRRLA